MPFDVMFVCPVGDEADDPSKQKEPLKRKVSSDELPLIPREGEAISLTFGMARVRAVVIGVQHLFVGDLYQGVVINLRSVGTD